MIGRVAEGNRGNARDVGKGRNGKRGEGKGDEEASCYGRGRGGRRGGGGLTLPDLTDLASCRISSRPWIKEVHSPGSRVLGDVV